MIRSFKDVELSGWSCAVTTLSSEVIKLHKHVYDHFDIRNSAKNRKGEPFGVDICRNIGTGLLFVVIVWEK